MKNLIRKILKEDEWDWAKTNPWDYYFGSLQHDTQYKIWVPDLNRSQIHKLLNVLNEYGYLTNRVKRANYDHDIMGLWFWGEGGLVKWVDYGHELGEEFDWYDAESYFEEEDGVEITIDEVKEYL